MRRPKAQHQKIRKRHRTGCPTSRLLGCGHRRAPPPLPPKPGARIPIKHQSNPLPHRQPPLSPLRLRRLSSATLTNLLFLPAHRPQQHLHRSPIRSKPSRPHINLRLQHVIQRQTSAIPSSTKNSQHSTPVKESTLEAFHNPTEALSSLSLSQPGFMEAEMKT